MAPELRAAAIAPKAADASMLAAFAWRVQRVEKKFDMVVFDPTHAQHRG
jgi:hypothetical protein